MKTCNPFFNNISWNNRLLFLVCLAFFFIASFLFQPCISYGKNAVEIKNTVVIGTGLIFSKNIATARERAVANSLVAAVNLALGEILPRDRFIRNFQRLDKTLLRQTSDYIQDYKVLTESAGPKQYLVLVEVNVAVNLIKDFLAKIDLFNPKKNLPSILFCLTEQKLDMQQPLYWWGQELIKEDFLSETAMAAIMAEKGFHIIRHRIVNQPLNYNLVLTDSQALSLGASLKADVVIIGSAAVERAVNTIGQEIKTFKGLTSARAVRVKTGEKIAFTNRSLMTANAAEDKGVQAAIKDVSRLAGEDMAIQIAAVWRETAAPSPWIELNVVGTGGNIAGFVKFRTILKELSGVNDIQLKELLPDKATIIVDFQGDARALANALMLKTFKTFGINIFEINQNNLKIRLIPNP